MCLLPSVVVVDMSQSSSPATFRRGRLRHVYHIYGRKQSHENTYCVPQMCPTCIFLYRSDTRLLPSVDVVDMSQASSPE